MLAQSRSLRRDSVVGNAERVGTTDPSGFWTIVRFEVP
jgi:hypothetical protein